MQSHARWPDYIHGARIAAICRVLVRCACLLVRSATASATWSVRAVEARPNALAVSAVSEKRLAYGTSRLDRMAGEGWLAAGGAAISFDPLAAQGILTAMYSGLPAGQAIGARLRHDGDAIGAYCARLDAIGRAFRQERRWAGHRYWRRRAGGS
jgi:hypothetical protein